ncbi:MAG: hypothetical protein IKK46_09675 [Clostridia bacterium]|nr:hypothetical protein [Clostridia bacterium]MBR3810558.1 hypothetical protein [Clostridia bacterium]
MRDKRVKLVIAGLVAVFFLSYLISQLVSVSKAEIETQIAMSETVYKTINTKCFVVRDEKYIENTAKGTTISFAANAQRVAKGDTVSMIFKTDEDAKTYLRITEITEELEHYNTLAGQANIQAVDVYSLSSKIETKLSDYLDSIDKGDFKKASESINAFGNFITSKQISTGEVLNLTEKINALTNELQTLQAKKTAYSEVKSDRAGYYLKGADGYENTIDFTKINELTTKDIENAINSKPQEVKGEVVGRTVGNFDWYILCSIDTEETIDLKDDADIFINFPYSGVEKLKGKIYKIGDRTENKTLVIIKCNLMNDALADFRIEDIQLITEEYTGYKIKNSAIRTVDGQTGVYVVSGNLIDFRKVHIAYNDGDYSIVDNPEGEWGYIKLYDEVVTKGVEMYDNKLV